MINIALLDRIGDRQKVLEILIDYQYQYIYTYTPKNLYLPELKQDYILMPKETQAVPMISQTQKPIVESNFKHFGSYKDRKDEYNYLESITVAINRVIAHEFKKALDKIDSVKALPFSKSSNVETAATQFESATLRLKWLLLGLLIVGGKCAY